MTCNKCGKQLEENTKFCDGCGTDLTAQVSNASTPAKPKKKRKTLLIIVIVCIAVIALLASLGGGSSDLTVANDNDTGALFNLTFDEYTNEFGENLDAMYEELGMEPTGFDLSDFWNNTVAPQTDYEYNSGKQFTTYSAFLTGAIITAKEIDGKIQPIDICFDFNEHDFAVVSAATTYMICGDMSFDEANEIFETVRNGIMDNTMVYKNGILYAVTASTVSYTIMAADNDFVKSLEESGSCNVLRW